MTSRKRTAAAKTAPAKAPARKMSISAMAVAMAGTAPTRERFEFKTYEPAPGVVPAKDLKSVLAMDSTPYGYLNELGGLGCFTGFPGYPYLAELTQIAEYRKMSSVLADEMTRKWIKLTSHGEGDKTDRIKKIDEMLRQFSVRELFKHVIEDDGYFGRGQVYIDVKTPKGVLATDDPAELATPLSLSEKKITKGSLVGFRRVEPMWTYPGIYNSTDPLKKDYYKPSQWYVMGKSVHASRMLMMISRPVPDMLKAAYSFGGLSMSQLAKPYIDHWIRTRDSVSDIIHSFSISGILTDMSSVLEGDSGQDLFKRLEMFNQTRDNRGVFALNKDSEEFFQFNTPLAGLDKLQAQAQEQQSSVSSIPLVKLLGITPAGLNADSDGEIRVFYDDVNSKQESQIRPPLKKIIDVIQLSEFGDIDPDIDFEFVPLYQLSEAEKAAARKADADTDAVLITASVITPEESRARVAADPESPYHSLELTDDDGIEPEEEEGEPTESADTKAA
jgi:phage-related protein (TIGR01555 family)